MTEAAQTEAKPEKEPKIQANGVTRPKAGTKTARIWEIADAKSAEAGKPAKRKEVLDAAVAEEINVATAATQYGRWRKFHGLKGSDEVETAAAETSSDVSTEGEGDHAE